MSVASVLILNGSAVPGRKPAACFVARINNTKECDSGRTPASSLYCISCVLVYNRPATATDVNDHTHTKHGGIRESNWTSGSTPAVYSAIIAPGRPTFATPVRWPSPTIPRRARRGRTPVLAAQQRRRPGRLRQPEDAASAAIALITARPTCSATAAAPPPSPQCDRLRTSTAEPGPSGPPSCGAAPAAPPSQRGGGRVGEGQPPYQPAHEQEAQADVQDHGCHAGATGVTYRAAHRRRAP